MRERRQTRRNPTRHRLNVRDAEDGKIIGRLVDITISGLMILTTHPFPANLDLRLRVPLPAGVHGQSEIEFPATTIWCEQDHNPKYYRVGFKIPDLGGMEAYAIETVLSRLHLVT